jgi:hypothetical protein
VSAASTWREISEPSRSLVDENDSQRRLDLLGQVNLVGEVIDAGVRLDGEQVLDAGRLTLVE